MATAPPPEIVAQIEAYLAAQRKAEQDWQRLYTQAKATVEKRLNEGRYASPYLNQLDEGAEWVQEGQDGYTYSGFTRQAVNNRACHYYHNDPILKNAVDLHNAYTLGRGVSVKADDPDIDAVIQDFWTDTHNQHTFTRANAMWRNNRDRFLNGEIFFALFVSTVTGKVRVRVIDCREIKDCIPSDNDDATIEYYHRKWYKQTYNFKDMKRERAQEASNAFIPDWRLLHTPAMRSRYDAALDIKNTEVYLYHLCSNNVEGRGLSHAATALPYIAAHKGFLEDRVTLQHALALFALKQKLKGNKNAADRMAQEWRNLDADIGWENNVPLYDRERTIGNRVLVENEAVNTEQFKTDSGANNAYTDGRMLRQPAAVGLGLFEHYAIGDASTGNLATTTAMELPMLKTFEFEQELWEGCIKDILKFAVYQARQQASGALRGKSEIVIGQDDSMGGSPIWTMTSDSEKVDLSIDVAFPPIVKRDVPTMLTALTGLLTAESTSGAMVLPMEQITRQLLINLDLADIAEQVISDLEEIGYAFPITAPNTDTGGDTTAPDDTEDDTGGDDNEPPPDDTDTGEGDEPPPPPKAPRRSNAQNVQPTHFNILNPTDVAISSDEINIVEVVGDAMPKDKALDTDPITTLEMNAALAEWIDKPELQDYLDELGLTIEDVD